jgi:hypothetical protein
MKHDYFPKRKFIDFFDESQHGRFQKRYEFLGFISKNRPKICELYKNIKIYAHEL